MSLRHLETRPTPPDCRAESRLDRWEAAGKPFFVLAQRGRFPDVYYDDGRLLAGELETGVFPEILATIAHDVDADGSLETGLVDRVQGAFFNRLSRDILRSCSDDFRRGVEPLERGYFAGLDNPRFDGAAVEHACVAIDTGNIATGFERIRAYRDRSRRYGYGRNYVLNAVTMTRWGRSYAGAATRRRSTTCRWPNSWSGPRGRAGRRAGMGCTGFWAAPGLTADGRGLHARTYDGAFFTWNEHPLVSLIVHQRERLTPREPFVSGPCGADRHLDCESAPGFKLVPFYFSGTSRAYRHRDPAPIHTQRQKHSISEAWRADRPGDPTLVHTSSIRASAKIRVLLMRTAACSGRVKRGRGLIPFSLGTDSAGFAPSPAL